MTFTLIIGGIGLFGSGVGVSLAWLVTKLLKGHVAVTSKPDSVEVQYPASTPTVG